MTNEHNYNKSSNLITIYVNGRAKQVQKGRVATFLEIVHLAFENPPVGEGSDFSIQFTIGHSDNPTGTLTSGQTVKLKKGMKFDVTPTNKS